MKKTVKKKTTSLGATLFLQTTSKMITKRVKRRQKKETNSGVKPGRKIP
jgi:hypothetical protein